MVSLLPLHNRSIRLLRQPSGCESERSEQAKPLQKV